MQDQSPIEKTRPKFRLLPAAQSYLLLLILFGYPAISLFLNRYNAIEPDKIVSRISQIYLPALLVQLFMLLLVLGVIGRTGDGYKDIGLAKTDITWSNALSGIIFFFGAWTLIILIKGAVERSGYLPEKEFIYLLPVTITEKIIWFFLSLGAALSEEITFRGFAVSRLKVLTGGYFIAAFLSAAAFSVGHLYQGIAGVFLTFVYGMLFAGLFIARRSVFPCIIAHFLQDIIIIFVFTGPSPN
jgi:membrane protease YdiL (CAAX protease family)